MDNNDHNNNIKKAHNKRAKHYYLFYFHNNKAYLTSNDMPLLKRNAYKVLLYETYVVKVSFDNFLGSRFYFSF